MLMSRLERLKREKMMTSLLFAELHLLPDWIKKCVLDSYDNNIDTIELHGGKNPEFKEALEL